MWPTGRAPHWVGRARELAVLHDSIEALRQGRGSVVPLAVRNALHAEAARQLAAADADPLSVARQLSLSGLPGKGWAAGRLTQAAPC